VGKSVIQEKKLNVFYASIIFSDKLKEHIIPKLTQTQKLKLTYSMASATKTVQKHYKKFCSYCKAKGLSESIFTSHFVKDKPGKDGKVCCPELLKNECGYCHGTGHTPSFCPKLKARDARRKAAAARPKAPRAKPVARSADGVAPTQTANMFAALAGYSTPPPKEAFPALPRGSAPMPPRPQGVWAAAATLSIAQLEHLLAAKRAASPSLSAAEQAFIDAQLARRSQTPTETAAGEAFFDNVADVTDAVVARASTDQPTLVRQGAKGSTPADAAALPMPAPGIALPEGCDLAADFGAEPSGDGWGSDCDE